LKRYLRKNKIDNPEERERLRRMTDGAVNKIMHTPTRNLRDFATDEGKYTLAEAVALLFDIE